MTAEEIVKEIFNEGIDFEAGYPDATDDYERFKNMIKEYAKEKCKEQRELCADRGSIGNADFIQTAPEPEFD